MSKIKTEKEPTTAVKEPKTEKVVETKGRVVRIGLDKAGSDVVRLDAEGYKLAFDDAEGNFRDLKEEEVRALSFDNQRSYWMAYHTLTDRLKTEAAGGVALIGGVNPVSSSASTRMLVEFVDPDFHKKWLERWIRPDEVREMSYRGYVPMSKKELKSVFSTTPGDVPTIATGSGSIEMYLYKISVANKAKLDKAEKDQSIGALNRMKKTVGERLEQIADETTPRANREGPVLIDADEEADEHVWHEEPKAVGDQ